MVVSENSRPLVLVATSNARLWKEFREGLARSYAIDRAQERLDLEIKIAKMRPAIGFIDLSLPGLQNLKNVFAIQRLSRPTKIVIITERLDNDEEILALKAGMKGYCNRKIDSGLIRKAVQTVERGKIWVRRGVIPRLVEELRFRNKKRASSSPLKQLTDRQFEIACLIADAASNKEIAGMLHISEAAVKSHMSAIFRKLGISGRVELAVLVRSRSSSRRTPSGLASEK
jgi:two-component system, NarL family, nitrate/nitrite response regulator NarL